MPDNQTTTSERDKLISFVFDQTNRRIRNVKLFRGNAQNLIMEDMCKVAREVIADTWFRETALPHISPASS